MFEGAAKKRVAATRLADGTGYSVAHLQNTKERISWDALMRILENLGAELDDEELKACGRSQLDRAVNRVLLLPGRLLFSLKEVYIWGAGPTGPVAQTNAAQEMTCTVVGEGLLRLDCTIRPGYECRREFWVIRAGFLESVPRSFGLPPAKVTLVHGGARDGRYDIELPPDHSVVNRVRERASWLFAAREAANELRKSNEELLREVEARRKAEEKLRKLNAELEKRVAERTNELELFSHSVAHDLRAPLRAINGFATAVIEDHGHVLDQEAKRQLGRVIDGAVRMGGLIDALLALSRITRAELRREPVDLGDLAKSVLDELRLFEPHRQVESSITGSFRVMGDPSLLRALMTNLLENAWKFTRARKPALITIARDGDVFSVRDNGLGFDMQHAKVLFAPFHRLLNAKDVAGTGIGLAIADRIVRRHGGKIWVDATPNEGATFSFTLGS
jgi:signal transduction histidine kinase